MSAKKHSSNSIGENRKARHDYEFLETYEAGIVLSGPEVKSLRAGHVSFTDAYVTFNNGEAFLIGLHIAPYTNSGMEKPIPDRTRVLLLHAAEIRELANKVEQKGLSVIPTRMYFKNSRVKVGLALGRGRQLHDHRQALKQRAENLDARRELIS